MCKEINSQKVQRFKKQPLLPGAESTLRSLSLRVTPKRDCKQIKVTKKVYYIQKLKNNYLHTVL